MWQPEQPPSQTVANLSAIHCFFSRAVTMNSSLRAVALHLADGRAFVEQGAGGAGHDALAAVGAGVGGAPGLVEVGDDLGLAPRPETFLVPAPSMCQQTRTQRVQRMQRLWSMPKSGWVLSTPHLGKQ